VTAFSHPRETAPETAPQGAASPSPMSDDATPVPGKNDGISPSLGELATLAQALGVENFGDLNGVEGGAFAEVVAAYEQG
jgi:hypothetical protein